MSLQLAVLLGAHVTLACAAIDYSDRNPFAWPEFIGASYVLAFGATL